MVGTNREPYWQASWALVLTPIGSAQARLDVRARFAFTPDVARWSARWLHPFHDFMDGEQLRHLKQRAEGRAPRAPDGGGPFRRSGGPTG